MLTLAVGMLAGLTEPQQTEAATGYTDHGHTWSYLTEGYDDCGGCKAVSGYADCTMCSRTGKVTCSTSGCSTCGGDGIYYVCERGTCTYTSASVNTHNCVGMGNNPGTSTEKTHMKSCSTCGGDGALSDTCKRCNGKGKNYYCTKEGCTLKSGSAGGRVYDYWETETTKPQEGSLTVCYTTENTYTIAFNGNGATGGSTANKTGVKYTAATTLTANGYSRTGYTFLGWSTSSTATAATYANKASVSKLSATNGATVTLYAVWKANTYKMIYQPNGASGSAKEESFTYNGNYTVKAANTFTRAGYTFSGWNTDPDATVGITSLTMSDSDIVLYAVYKKDIILTIIEQTDSGKKTRTLKKTIYNKETETDFTLTKVNSWSGWTLLGWTVETGTEDYPQVDVGGIITADESLTLHALYEKRVTITYDTNGSALTFEPETKYAYHNASGNSTYPSFTLQKAPELSNSSFVKWQASDGNSYNAQEELTLTDSLLFTAVWDTYPELIAYNRHFTLEQAKDGHITQAELLAKVTATDEEDGTLVNGSSVIVVDYNASVFTEMTTDTVVTITYEATDSFGNTVTKAITVTVTDTTAKPTSRKSYVRFISSNYFTDNTGALLTKAEGGLEENSVWRTNTSYRNLLTSTLSNAKTGVETKKVTAFGGEWEIKVAGSGDWNKKEETWVFTRADIQEMKIYTGIYGHVFKAMEMFFELFIDCRK